jgi:LysM repeat protein
LSNVKKLLILAFVLMPGFALADGTTQETINPDLTPVAVTESVKEEAPKPPVVHEVQEGDTLSGIAETNETIWTRIYDANTEVENPDLIQPGEKLKIPKTDEQIASRSLPTPPEPAPVAALPAAIEAPAPTTVSAVSTVQELIGSYGYLVNGPNCVNTAKAHGKNQPGNPISWVPTTQIPFIGAAALFSFNHVAIVSGIHSNGDIEVIHENCPGCPTRYPRSEFRGFF